MGWTARRRAAAYAAEWGKRAHYAIALAHRMHGQETAAVFVDSAGQCAGNAFHWAAVVVDRDGQAAGSGARPWSENQTAGGILGGGPTKDSGQ